MTAVKVSPDVLQAMWGAAAEEGKDSALELGHPKRDVLVVDGRKVAWSAKPKKRVT
jgi:hypothetical protein